MAPQRRSVKSHFSFEFPDFQGPFGVNISGSRFAKTEPRNAKLITVTRFKRLFLFREAHGVA